MRKIVGDIATEISDIVEEESAKAKQPVMNILVIGEVSGIPMYWALESLTRANSAIKSHVQVKKVRDEEGNRIIKGEEALKYNLIVICPTVKDADEGRESMRYLENREYQSIQDLMFPRGVKPETEEIRQRTSMMAQFFTKYGKNGRYVTAIQHSATTNNGAMLAHAIREYITNVVRAEVEQKAGLPNLSSEKPAEGDYTPSYSLTKKELGENARSEPYNTRGDGSNTRRLEQGARNEIPDVSCSSMGLIVDGRPDTSYSALGPHTRRILERQKARTGPR